MKTVMIAGIEVPAMLEIADDHFIPIEKATYRQLGEACKLKERRLAAKERHIAQVEKVLDFADLHAKGSENQPVGEILAEQGYEIDPNGDLRPIPAA